MAFEEIIAGPLSVYIAPVGTTFPTLDAAPAADWVLLGTNGDKNYSEEGVQISHNATFAKHRGAGSPAALKAFLDTEDLMIRLTLVDITLEEYARAVNANAITATAAGVGTMGKKKLGLSRNGGLPAAREFAVLARGTSPEVETLPAQFCVPRAYNAGNAEPIFRRGQPARLALMLDALYATSGANDAERFGYVEVGTAAALPEE